MESLRGLPEHTEADFGDSIVARDEAIAVLATTPGLGPPDLCHLQKCPKRTGLFGSSGESQGYYHFVLGRDVSSSAAVAAYFALLNAKVEHRSMLQGLWMSPEYVIERGFYCCYDAISRMDVRCELCVPGGVVVGAVDAAGQLHDATPQIWQQAQVSAFVRATLYDPEMRLNGGSIIAYDPCATAASEASLLNAVLDLYSTGALPAGLQDISVDMGFGVAADHMDPVLAALWQHFRRRQRWQVAADFFRELMQVYSPAALLLSAAERAQGLSPGAGGPTLSELLARPVGSITPHATHALVPATMVGLGHELLEQGESEAAASLARRALAASPRCRPAWLLLAKCFVADRQYAAALVALNVVPTPPLPAAEVELLHVVPPPAPKATTQPQMRLYDGELEAARWCALEEASLDGSRLLAYLPGSILVNKEPLGTAFQSDVCPNRVTRSVLTAVYDLLQAIVKEVSWDQFLEVRSRVFLMQHEVAQSPAHNSHGGNNLLDSNLSTKHSVSSEITPAGQPQDSSPRQQLAAIQAAQQAALLRKLEQLGLSADTPASTPPHSSPPVGTIPASIPTSSSSPPAKTSGGGRSSGGGGGTPAAAGAGGLALLAGPGSVGPSPPASRGRLSSAGGGASHRGGGSPQSYYASRLQEELSKPIAAPSSGGGSAGSGRASTSAGGGPLPFSQLAVKVPGEQQQQQQQPVVAPLADKVASPCSAGSAAAAAGSAPRAQTPPGEGQRSMAGRVLLLGKKAAPRSSSNSSGRPHSSRSVAPVGCGVPRNLAPNEVEDLSKYATASKVASLRVPASIGVTPELWAKVFGGGSSSAEPSTAAATAAPAAPGVVQAGTTSTSSADSDDGLSAAAAGLPRIRTRPLGEQVEEECWLEAGVGYGGGGAAAAAPARHYCCTMQSFLQCQGCSCCCRDLCSSSGSSSSWRVKCFAVHSSSRNSSRQGGQAGGAGSSRCRVTSSRQQQPLGEGLDRTASLLNRTTSTASAGPLQGTSSNVSLPRASSLRQQQSQVSINGSIGLHNANSGSLSARGSRRLSLAGEAANRSLEADREGLCKGWVHDDASAQAGWGGVDGVGSPGAGGRRLCVRWLDELIVALWHDLQAHMEWKVVDQTLRETRGATAAELVLGLAPSAVDGSPTSATSAATSPATVPNASDGGAFEPPLLTSADWMRRGALAERLGHTLDARSAYRASVKLSFNLTSYLALMRLEAEAESTGNTALCAAQILGWLQQRAGQPQAGSGSEQGASLTSSASSSAAAAAASGGLVMMGVPPAEVSWALGLVADGSSADEVRRAVADVNPAAQGMLLAVLEEWVRWQGFQVQPALAARQLRRR